MPEESFEEQASLRGIHAFLVVDDPDSRELIKTVLEYAGALVSAVASARGALAALEAIRPDVLIADLGGDGDGAVALIERVRKLPGAGDMPAIVITARGGREERQRLLKAGFQHYVLKPVDPWELCRLVATLAERGS
ncbi:MAG TPA: response regulator [Methylomirabilota bacterium]|jgi:CheY-like chemotaxis protein